MKNLILLVILFGSLSSAFGEPETKEVSLSPWEAYKNQQDSINGELLNSYNNLSASKDDNKERFLKVNDLWKQVAIELKEGIKTADSTDYTENINSEEGRLYWQELVTQRFDLLRKVSNSRVEAMEKLRNDGVNVFFVDENLFESLWLEIEIVPYKLRAYFQQKKYLIKKTNFFSFQSIIDIFVQIIILGLILYLPFLFFRWGTKLKKYLEKRRQQSFYLSFKSRFHKILSQSLPLASELTPWLIAMITLLFINKLVLNSKFSEAALVLPYLKYYFYYKIFRILVEYVLNRTLSRFGGPLTQAKIKKSSLLLGLFLLITYCLEHTFQSILGESLSFSLIKPFFGFLILFILIYISTLWKSEIFNYLRKTKNTYLNKVSEIENHKLVIFTCFPLIVFIFLHFGYVIISQWAVRFDLVKLIYAKILRIKIENSQKNTQDEHQLPVEYKNVFLKEQSRYKDYFSIDETPFKETFSLIEQWQNNLLDEQTLAIYGEEGSYKTATLKVIEEHQKSKGLDVTMLDTPKRTFTEKNVKSFLDECVGVETPNSDERKKVVLIKDAHNMFLSTIGGFKAYQYFLEFIENRKDIFWIVSFNDAPWTYINSVLGKNQYFRSELKVPRWSMEKIKNLILTLHKTTDMKLVYDDIFTSSQSLDENVETAENRYFYLLWEKSAGNPGVSIRLWLRSLNFKGNNRFKVSLPRDNETGVLSKLHADTHFVYAALLKHGNLTLSEATRAVNLPRAKVKQALFRGVEENFLSVESGRYTINLDWSTEIIRFLKGKNLIYER